MPEVLSKQNDGIAFLPFLAFFQVSGASEL